MSPADDTGTTTLAWIPVGLTLFLWLLGIICFYIRRSLNPAYRASTRELWERIGWYWIGAGCGVGGLFIWWMLT